MNKAELIGAVAESAGTSKRESEKIVNATLELITQRLAEGEKVQLVGFGAFDVKVRAPRLGRNPQTKRQIDIAATRVAVFKPGKALKDAVAK